jgi:pilus assembly protein CpaC
MSKKLNLISKAILLAMVATPALAQTSTPSATEANNKSTKIAVVTKTPSRTVTKAALVAPHSAVVSALMPLTLYVGEVRTLPFKNLTRVAVGNGKVLSSTVLEDELLLLAEGAGDTSLYLWEKNGDLSRYKVRIYANDVDDAKQQVDALLSGMTGIKVERINDAVVVKGQASKANIARIDMALKNIPKVINLVTEEDVTMKKMIYLKVQIMEFKKSALESLGVQWGASAPGPALALAGDAISNSQFRFAPTTQLPTFAVGQGAASALSIPNQIGKAYFGIATALNSTINLSVNNGDAWILASPELSTRSGGEAKFLAGGQIPLPSVSATGQSSVSFKDYGIKLTVRPNADDKGNISASISTELSDVDPAITVQGIPGFLMRSTESEVNVKSGQTIVMSGLLDQKSSNDTNKFPFLGDVPILGALFKSNNYKNGRTDLVIFVTPMITDPTSTTNVQRIEKAKDLRERFEAQIGNKGIVD